MAGGQGRDMRGREVHREQTLGGRGAPARVRLNAERLAFQEPPCPLWERTTQKDWREQCVSSTRDFFWNLHHRATRWAPGEVSLRFHLGHHGARRGSL